MKLNVAHVGLQFVVYDKNHVSLNELIGIERFVLKQVHIARNLLVVYDKQIYKPQRIPGRKSKML